MTTVHFGVDDVVARVEDGDARVLADGAFDVECLATTGEALLVGTVDAGLVRRPHDHGRGGGGAADGFAPVAGIDEDRVTSLAVGPEGVCWAGTEPSSVYRSTDGGRTWTELPGLTDLPSSEEWSFPPRPHTHHVRWLEPAPGDPDRLYVGVEAGAFVLATGVTDPEGVEWRERPPGSRRDNHTLATHPDAPDRVYSAAGDGYAESTDGGETWREAMEGLDHRYCWSVAVDPADPDTRVMSAASGAYRAHRSGSAESYCYRRTGDGPWERVSGGLPTGEGVLRAVLDSGGAGEFYAVNSEGLYRSDDAGATWQAVELGAAWLDRFADEPPRGLVVG